MVLTHFSTVCPLDHVVVEELLQFLIGEVDAQLLHAVVLDGEI